MATHAARSDIPRAPRGENELARLPRKWPERSAVIGGSCGSEEFELSG